MPYATDYTTLLSGSYWSGAEITGQPVFVTYSFDATAPASDSGHLAASALATFTPLSAAQQTEVQKALTEWSSSSSVAGGGSGVIFLQVAPGKGDINFASYDFSSDPNNSAAGGLGYFPWGNWNYSTFTSGSGHFAADLAGSGNVLLNTAFESGGLFAYATVLHEIGHALGLKHPTDAWTDNVPGYINVAHNQWDPSVTYNSSFSIMSPGATTLTDPTTADWQAIQSIYGTPAMAAEQDASWSWNSTTYTLTQTLKSGGQTVRGVSTNNIINGGSGNDVIYAIGSGKNTIYGEAGNDVLVGGAGTSYLDGGPGADVLNGWFGTSYASYKDAKAGVTADLLNPSLNTGDAAGDTYLHISRIIGSNYSDTLIADNNGDVIEGGSGNDTLVGGTGKDTIIGGTGNDTIIGGPGSDKLTGGTGDATFVYKSITDSTPTVTDVITDFHSGDKIDLSAIDADTGTAGVQHFHFGKTAGHTGDIVVTYDSTRNRTVVDLYNSSISTPAGRILLSGNHADLTAADFILTPPAAKASTALFAQGAATLTSHSAAATTVSPALTETRAALLAAGRWTHA